MSLAVLALLVWLIVAVSNRRPPGQPRPEIERPALRAQIERWENTPWTQRTEDVDDGLTPARRLSDECGPASSQVPAFDQELDFHER